MESLSQSFRALGDTTRLRLLRLLAEAPLNVSELVSLVGVAQSSVSHHLAKLRALGLVREERQAGYSYYALAVAAGDPRWPLIQMAVEQGDDGTGDLARLKDLLRGRENRLALNEKLLEPGQSWFVWSRAVASLLPRMDVADFGCGTGALTFALAGAARSATGIDRNATLLRQARARARREGLANVRFVRGDLHALEIPAASFDLVVISQSLHHVEDPARVLGEAARVLRPQSRLVVLELLPHRETWVRERLGHRALGFKPESLGQVAAAAGFRGLRTDVPPHDAGSPFRVFILTGATR
jgi:ArsR family transcriptional regulator